MLELAGVVWPYGPAQVAVTAAPRPASEHRCLVRWPAEGLTLEVDAGLPAPVAEPEEEGPLAVVAQALRGAAPRRALTLEVEAPVHAVVPWRLLPTALPGLVRAAACAAAAAQGLEAPVPAGPLQEALAARAPRALSGEAVQPGATAWLGARLLLFADPLEAGPAEDPAPLAALLARADRDLAAVADLGLAGRTARERDLLGTLRRAGLVARLPAGPKLAVGLCEPAARDTLRAALYEHDLIPLECALHGVDGGGAR